MTTGEIILLVLQHLIPAVAAFVGTLTIIFLSAWWLQSKQKQEEYSQDVELNDLALEIALNEEMDAFIREENAKAGKAA